MNGDMRKRYLAKGPLTSAGNAGLDGTGGYLDMTDKKDRYPFKVCS